MNTLEIYFAEAGNTIIGPYCEYMEIMSICRNQGIGLPMGYTLKIPTRELVGFKDRLYTFASAIQTVKGWATLARLSRSEFFKSV